MSHAISSFVDVHTHLTHEDFGGDVDEVVSRAEAAGLGAIVVNGLEPVSNRQILGLAKKHKVIKPALGIYPIDAVNDLLPADFPHPVPQFDIDAELAFIKAQALQGHVFALGECGLDGYWLGPETFAKQEEVFEGFIKLALEVDLPLIIHTRKLEARAIEILAHHRVKRVNFHCFGGKVKLAIKAAEEHGWWFSIPANAPRNDAFRKMLTELPVEKILTETDAPYLTPEKDTRNEPKNVVGTVKLFSEIRGWSLEQGRDQIWKNFNTLFQPTA